MYGKIAQLLANLLNKIPAGQRAAILNRTGQITNGVVTNTKTAIEWVKQNPLGASSLILNIATLSKVGYDALRDKDAELIKTLDEADPTGGLSARYRQTMEEAASLHMGNANIAATSGGVPATMNDALDDELHDVIQFAKRFFGNETAIRRAHRKLNVFFKLSQNELELGMHRYYHSNRPVRG